MAISRKNRRRIVVAGREYLWWVVESEDDFPSFVVGDFRALNIVSANKQFIVRLYLGQYAQPERRHLVIIGPEFAGRIEPGPWRRYWCPEFCLGKAEAVTPAHVRSIIEWCADSGAAAVPVDYSGAAAVPAVR